MKVWNRSWGWLDPVRRLLWLPIVVGVLAGVAVAATTEAAVEESTTAVVNTRAASSLPNDRLDLINDLVAVADLSTVTNPVARENGLSGAALRAGLSVERIEASTLTRLTLSAPGDDEFRRGVLADFLAAAQEYLTPETPSPSLVAARAEERRAITAYYEALAENNGQDPVETFDRLAQRIVDAQVAGNTQLQNSLESFVPRATRRAAEFAAITTRRTTAEATARNLATSEATQSRGGPSALELSFVASTSEPGLTDSVPLRRGLAAGLAAALVVAGLLLLLARGRRLR